jgi:outer membrane protein assembly factor BamB
MARCAGDKTVAISRRAGRLYTKGVGECEDCVAPPPGCLVARPKLGDVKGTPILLGDGTVVVPTDDAVVKVDRDGKVVWRSKVNPFGQPVLDQGEIVALVAEEKDARLVALDPASGEVRWGVPFALALPFVLWGTDAVLEARGGFIVAGYKNAITWFERPR